MSNETITLTLPAILQALSASATVRQIEYDGETTRQIAIHEKDFTITDLEPYQATPYRIREAVKAEDVPSFLLYCEKFSNENSVIFAEESAGRYQCVFDYHAKGSPEWGTHSVTLNLVDTPEWKTWTLHSGKKKNQLEFAAFIESNLADVAGDSAALLEAVLALESVRDVKFRSSVKLASGEMQFAYSDMKTDSAGAVDVPTEFQVSVAAFKNAERHTLKARLRYRISEGALTLWYELDRPHEVYDAAARAVTAAIREKTGMPVFCGARR